MVVRELAYGFPLLRKEKTKNWKALPLAITDENSQTALEHPPSVLIIEPVSEHGGQSLGDGCILYRFPDTRIDLLSARWRVARSTVLRGSIYGSRHAPCVNRIHDDNLRKELGLKIDDGEVKSRRGTTTTTSVRLKRNVNRL